MYSKARSIRGILKGDVIKAEEDPEDLVEIALEGDDIGAAEWALRDAVATKLDSVSVESKASA